MSLNQILFDKPDMRNLNFDAHFKDLFDSTSDLIHFVGIDGEILKANPAWLNTLEYRSEEVIEQNIYGFISPLFREQYKIHRAHVIANSVVADIEFAFVSKTGKKILVEGQVGCVYDLGQPVYTRGVFRDVTAKRRIENDLEKNQRRFRTFIENAPMAVVIIDQHQIVQEWNPKAEDIFDYQTGEVLGRPLADIIIPQQYREAHARGMAHFLKTGEGPVLNKTIEISALHKNGHEFPVNLSISSVKIDDDWLFIAFISDITEQKKLHQEIIRHQADLLLVKIEEDKKDQFLSMASHELKTPLTSLKAFLQLLERKNIHNSSFQLFGKASGYVRKLEKLVSDLLDISKIKADKVVYQFEDFSFYRFLTESVHNVQLFTESHQIIIEHCDDAICKGDILRLEQVIHNLLTNAVKYSPDATVVCVNARIDQNNMIVSIKDFGIGIAPEYINEVFNRFYRVEHLDMKFQGLGIGLFITKEIVERHQGKLWVESEKGKGSVFSFSLPVNQIGSN